MTYKQYFKRALSLAPHVVMIKIYQFALFRLKSYFLQTRDSVLGTYSQANQQCEFRPIFSAAPEPGLLLTQFPELEAITKKTMDHEFDLLGSGWVKVFYGMSAKGLAGIRYPSQMKSPPTAGSFSWINNFINSSNRRYCQFVWQKVAANYTPINWHSDIKSGYEWNASTWWYRIPYGHKPGVDIKLPWELARNHHLAWLALSFGKVQSEQNQNQAALLANEFQNQILDFIATNPPRYGVNWRCAMDVSIRAANWILAYEWFRLYGFSPETDFKSIFANSLTDHGRYIFSNLEIGKDGFRGNHYLADVCGLTFIAAFLPETGETTHWQDFCHKALIAEMDYQFFDEGTNFEGSTSYHRLSSEMILYASLVFLQSGKKNYSFDQRYLTKLLSLGKFSDDVLKPNGEIVQIGDCDNGRFFKIQPLFYENTLDENHLTHKCLTEAISSLRGQSPASRFIEAHWFTQLKFENIPSKDIIPKTEFGYEAFPSELSTEVLQIIQKDEFSPADLKTISSDFNVTTLNHSLNDSISISYSQFGLFIWKSTESLFTFRCGKVGQKERGGHDHNDQLSYEFFNNGTLQTFDPGTAIYTPLPNVRNLYRSILIHNGPLVQDESGRILEPGPLDQGLFSMNGNQSCVPLYFNRYTMAGYSPKLQTVRVIKKQSTLIYVIDICLSNKLRLKKDSFKQIPISKGYGHFDESYIRQALQGKL